MGAKTLSFESDDPADPAKFYINTCPAHKTYPTVKIDIDKANKRPLGAVETCNKRVINQYIHPAVMQSCQLCMGMTQLAPGSNWNSCPAIRMSAAWRSISTLISRIIMSFSI